MDEQRALSQLHYELIHNMIENGSCPANSELADRMRLSQDELEGLLRSLSAIHGVVLHPHACKPWVIHPFSSTPTINCIEGKGMTWWAPCMWCALGAATLVGGQVRIFTRFGAESEPLVIPVREGRPIGFEEIFVHFAIPPAQAWNNVHEHCSMVLPFRSVDDIQDWCNHHRLPLGQAVPLHQAAQLARQWYGSHADPNWHKWTISEAQEIFHQAGLRSDFWNISTKTGRF
jgi:Alkylmercury lyase